MASTAAANVSLVLKISAHLLTSTLAITIWDWLTCLNIEYHRIWRSKWTVAKGLYIFARYWSLVTAIVTVSIALPDRTIEECSHLYKLYLGTQMWTVIASEGILAIRTYAFLGRNPRFLALMIIMLLAECGYMLIAVIDVVYQLPLSGPSGTCVSTAPPGPRGNLNLGVFIAPFIFDFFVTALTIGKAIRLRREGLRSNWLHFFVREGLIYFLVVTILNLANMIIYIQDYSPVKPIIALPTRQISAILACRLILSLRNPKVFPPKSTLSSFYYETGYETVHDSLAPAQVAPILPTPAVQPDQVSGKRNGPNSESNFPSGVQTIGGLPTKAFDDDDEDDDDE